MRRNLAEYQRVGFSCGAELEVGQFASFVVDIPAVVVRTSTLEHVFCNVGSSVR